MIWEFCKYCRINGKCENQERGHKCETGYKILFEEKEKLKKQINYWIDETNKLEKKLDIALKGLKFISSQCYGKDMYDCAKGTLKQLEMLQNPENVTENVANQKAQHCESENILRVNEEWRKILNE